jgi:hypothetical protein
MVGESVEKQGYSLEEASREQENESKGNKMHRELRQKRDL